MRYFQVCPLLFTLTAAHPQLYGWHRPVRTDGNGNTVVNVEHLDELVSDRHGHILKYFFQRKTWNAAKKHCEDLGGTLPLIEDATKNLEVAYWMIRLSHWGVMAQWLGYKDVNDDGNYVDHEGKAPYMTYWATGEPKEYPFMSGKKQLRHQRLSRQGWTLARR